MKRLRFPHIAIWLLLAAGIACWWKSTQRPRPLTTEAYVWQRGDSAELRKALKQSRAVVSRCHFLGAEIGRDESGWQLSRTTVPDELLAGHGLVLRIGASLAGESWRDGGALERVLDEAGRMTAKPAAEFQIDFDCPQRSLDDYRVLLEHIKKRFPDKPWTITAPQHADVPTPSDFPEVPRDIAAYWSAAREWRGGDLPAARTAWQAILDLPESDRHYRAVWAAWMCYSRADFDAARRWLAQAPPDAGEVQWLRYLLARRLAREFRFREAEEFMPHALSRFFEHYVRLHRASRNGSWSNETKALILWELAFLRRHLGVELFGYEGAPDNTHWDGSFPGLDYLGRRSHAAGWHFSWDDEEPAIKGPGEPADIAVPPVSREEMQRMTPHLAAGEPRFHYRHDAAEIAWRAAALLPDNDPRTLFMLHEAGRWLAVRDPQAADRFYQEIIRRCPRLPLGRELDRRRWFQPQPPENLLPDLPEELRFTNPDVALISGD